MIHQRSATVLELRKAAEGGSLLAILDACDAPAVPAKIRRLGEPRAASLYKGNAATDLWAIAPYLVAVDPDLFDWIIATRWAEPWGIFLRSQATIETLQHHFRKFLMVETPDGDTWYFRFYDPRVLPRYLRTCADEQLAEFYGPIDLFAVTDAETYGVVMLSRDPVTLVDRESPVRVRFKGPHQASSSGP